MSLARILHARALMWRTHLAYRELARLDALRTRRADEAAALLASCEVAFVSAHGR